MEALAHRPAARPEPRPARTPATPALELRPASVPAAPAALGGSWRARGRPAAAGVAGVAAAAAAAWRRRPAAARRCGRRQGPRDREGTEAAGGQVEPDAAGADKGDSQAEDPFDWQKAWYPLAVVADLDPGRPARLELLGEDLVAWLDGEGVWRVFEDRCPHRNVPLSEGRVEEDGTLLCSYHGWRFSGEGRVVGLPQLPEADWQRLRGHPRACAAVRPAQVRHGLLWVWGESSDNAALESALVEPNIVEELEDPAMEGRAADFVWQHRDLPYGWEAAIENVVDASHVAVTHHNMISNRYTDPAPIETAWERRPSKRGGFKFRMKSLKPRKGMEQFVSTTDFRPPGMVHNRATAPSGASTTLLLYFSPTKPGRCRLLVSFLVVRGVDGEDAPKAMPNAKSSGVELRQAGFALLQSPLFPRWFVHVVSPLFLHQDLVFLHRQQSILQRRERGLGSSWRQGYWTPAQTDAGSVALRRWLDWSGGVGWSPSAAVSTQLVDEEKSALFDTYHSHTEQCVHCRQALSNFTLAEKALGSAALVAGAAGLSSADWGLLAGGLALGLGSEACGAARRLFYEYRYEAQDNN